MLLARPNGVLSFPPVPSIFGTSIIALNVAMVQRLFSTPLLSIFLSDSINLVASIQMAVSCSAG